jgi:hypothetical protein
VVGVTAQPEASASFIEIANDTFMHDEGVRAPTNAGTQVGSEGLKAGSRTILTDLDAAVTVKAPKPSDTRR